ncbi:MAG: hypothetical protein HDS88_00880 [Bacteroidales bacterium]|nr:hypothetical protein [Bacteroidales bacterium]
MTPKDLFYKIADGWLEYEKELTHGGEYETSVVFRAFSRVEIYTHLQEITQNFTPVLVEALYKDFEELLDYWHFDQMVKNGRDLPPFYMPVKIGYAFQILSAHRATNTAQKISGGDVEQSTISEVFTSNEFKQLLHKLLQEKFINTTSEASYKYKWNKTKALFGWFVYNLSEHIEEIQTENGNINWQMLFPLFGEDLCNNGTVRNAATEAKKKDNAEPDGFREIKDAFKKVYSDI